MKNPKNKIRCVICRGWIDPELGGWRGGHNASPISEGRCCAHCNDTCVVPTRLAIHRGELGI